MALDAKHKELFFYINLAPWALSPAPCGVRIYYFKTKQYPFYINSKDFYKYAMQKSS
jgi:hypothetical protein